MNKKTAIVTLLLCSGIIQFGSRLPEEGMFPLSEIHKLDLKKAGLKIDQNEIYNPNGISLVDALVSINGCTGAFVSKEGLIITNHHCASLNNGFVAINHEQELEAKGLTCRITDSYEDVSNQVLSAVAAIDDPSSRLQTINNTMKNIVAEAEKKDPTIKAEVSEMFIGKTYVLFRYKTILDVRLVYIPNQKIGEFGSEWSHHTGDYSFMRAYVAKDGSSAKYSKDNVPYTPKKFLKVNPNGTNEEDFVFILGYPRKTFRHRPAAFINYQEKYLLPYTSGLYDFQNKAMENIGKRDKNTELKLATRIKKNANVMRNYRGKLNGLKNIGLISQKKQEDTALAQFIDNNVDMKMKYGDLMPNIDQLYQQINGDAHRDLWMAQIYNSTSLLNIAKQLNNFKAALESQPIAQKDAYFKANIDLLKLGINGIYNSFDIEVDAKILKKMMTDASRLSSNQRVSAVNKIINKGSSSEVMINDFINETFSLSKLKDQSYILNNILKSVKSIAEYNDGLLLFEKDIARQINELKPEKDRREDILNKLMGDYVNVKEKFLQKYFIPDANNTLRLTYGYVRGYTSADANFMAPYTTLNDVPVSFLYNMDTTGGNSGSPIMNANGELVGVNFGRTYGATINDYAWNEGYSRSIGVDIRYILWVASKIDQADFLLKEMGINF